MVTPDAGGAATTPSTTALADVDEPKRAPRYGTVAGFVVVGLVAAFLARTGYVGYFDGLQADADRPGVHAVVGTAVLLIAWTPLIAVLTLAPIAVLRAARHRTTWWLPLVALGVGGTGVLGGVLLLQHA